MVVAIAGKNADIPGTSGATFAAAPSSVPALGDFPSLVSVGQMRDIHGQFVGGMSSSWLGFTSFSRLPSELQDGMREGLDKTLEEMQTEMVDWARGRAPWADDTGDARRGLNSPAIVEGSDGSKTLILAHGVDYGIFLETMEGGVFGIIPATIRHFAALLPQMQAYYVRTKVSL